MRWLLGFFLIGTHIPVPLPLVQKAYTTELECRWDGDYAVARYNPEHWNGLIYDTCEPVL